MPGVKMTKAAGTIDTPADCSYIYSVPLKGEMMKVRLTRGRADFPALIFAIFFSLLLTSGCGDERLTESGEDPAQPYGSLLSAGGCKDFIADRAVVDPSLYFDCFEYSYDPAGELLLTHINAGLNCCPGTIQADISIEGRTITISEREGPDAPWCHCLCLYDIEYRFTDISPGRWTIVFKGPCTGDEEDLQGEVILDTAGNDLICLERFIYPWNTGYSGSPTGELISYDGCKDKDVGVSSLSTAAIPGETCALYDYDGNTLFIDHINAVFNCCQDKIEADISIEGNIITITESEDPPGGLCDCICLFDLTCLIRDLPPGIYTIRFVEPYLAGDDPALEFTADLSYPCSGEECVSRNHYPWGGE